jgi:hypothetical protein
MYRNYIKLAGVPVYVGPFTAGVPDPLDLEVADYWLHKDFVVEGGNALMYGPIAALRVEFFFSPRLLAFLNVQYRAVFATKAYRYAFGGVSVSEDQPFSDLSGWIPGITPYGDDVDISFHSIGVYLGISASF